MKITACPKCGSKNIDIAGMRDGSTPSIHWETKVCEECGWTGTPLEFDSENDYQIFLDCLGEKSDIDNADYFEDPAESDPIWRYMDRYTITVLLALAIFGIPGLVYFSLSIFGGLPSLIGALFAVLSIIGYIYIVWKKELWNIIKR